MGARSGAGRKHIGDPGSEVPVVLHQRSGELGVAFETIAEPFGEVFNPSRVAEPLAVTPLEAVPTTDRDVSGLLKGGLVLPSHGTALLPRLRHGLDDSAAPLVSEVPRWTISHSGRLHPAGSSRPADRQSRTTGREIGGAGGSAGGVPLAALALGDERPPGFTPPPRGRWPGTRDIGRVPDHARLARSKGLACDHIIVDFTPRMVWVECQRSARTRCPPRTGPHVP
jgi:hypothetical protein